MDNDYSSERLEYQSGQRNEKRAAGRIYPPAEEPDRTGVGADRRGGVRHSRHVLLGNLREVLSMRILGIDPGYATTGFGIFTGGARLGAAHQLRHDHNAHDALVSGAAGDALRRHGGAAGHGPARRGGGRGAVLGPQCHNRHRREPRQGASFCLPSVRRIRRCSNTRRIRSSRPSSATAARTSTRSWR